jgi:hypothetical protein
MGGPILEYQAISYLRWALSACTNRSLKEIEISALVYYPTAPLIVMMAMAPLNSTMRKMGGPILEYQAISYLW